MKTKYLSKITSLILVLVVLVSLTACSFNPFNSKFDPIDDTKEQILSAVESSLENDSSKYSYVYKYLSHWGISGFDSTKVKYIEDVFKYYYVLDDGLPDTLIHAADTAKLFLEKYYDTVDLYNYVEVTDAILNCYVDSVGDPYAYYRTAEKYEEYQDGMSGTFGGVGITIESNHAEKTLLVKKVFKDGPAYVSGMQVGDYIIGVDGKTLDELGGYDKAVNFVRGKIGTEVTVTVNRNGEIIDITMIRDVVVEPSVEYSITDEGYGYVAISSFKSNTTEQFKEAIDALENEGAIGYIFDLRSNPGGYVDAAVEMISYILPNNNLVISCNYKSDPPYHYMTKNDNVNGVYQDHIIDLPIVILCNNHSASSAEIFISCLRDHRAIGTLDKLVLVGTNTFGKGIIQASAAYKEDNSHVTLTIAYFTPPLGVSFHGIGIAPDITVELSSTEDTQLAEAIRQLDLLVQSK